jgi:membrane protein required for colicin V production
MIDVIFAILMILAIIKGIRKGLAVAVFSIIAYIIGLAAALKLSAVVAVYLQHQVSISNKWLPFISFALVFLIVVVLVNWGGKLMEQTFEMAFLGGANKIGGVLVYVLLYSIIFSVLLFYAEKIKILSAESISQSIVYPYLRPWAPTVIELFAKLIPWFKDSFSQLEQFFEGVANKINL